MRLGALSAAEGRPHGRLGGARAGAVRAMGLAGLAVLGATLASAAPVATVRTEPEPKSADHLYGYVASSQEVLYFYRPPSVPEQVKAYVDFIWSGLRVKPSVTKSPAVAPARQPGPGPTEEQQRSAGLATLALAAGVWLAHRVRQRRKRPAASLARLPEAKSFPYSRFARPALERAAAPPAPPAARPPLRLPTLSDLKGSLSAIPMGAVLQMLGAECATGVLHMEQEDGGTLGQLVLVEGRILDASARGQRGRDAFFDLFSHRKGAFRFSVETSAASQVTIQEDMVSLLLEAHRRMDEAMAGAAAGPRAA